VLTVEDLIAPKGKLTEPMFPSGDLEEHAEAWLVEAQAKTTSAPAQRAWVYYRACDAVLDRVMLEAFSERKGDASAARSEQQLAHWRRERDRNLAAFNGLMGGSQGVGGVVPVAPVW